MFGNSSNSTPTDAALDKLIKRATDETLTNDNWQYILEVCDKISQDPEEATKLAIKSISQRLALKDANVNLRTLSLLVAVAENCGSRMKQEIATTLFLQELLKKLGDRRVHTTVKEKIAEVISQLHESFKDDPSLKPMTQAYQKLNKSHRGGAAPVKPDKREMTLADRAREEEELQRTLKLSLNEYEREQQIFKQGKVPGQLPGVDMDYLKTKPLPERQDSQEKVDKKKLATLSLLGGENSKQLIATISKVRALYDLISYEPDELSFRTGDIITVIESVYRDWWKGTLPSGKTGIFPLNYVTPVVTKSPEELAEEIANENKLLSIDLKKVDQLLALLSNPSTASETDVTRLYNEIVPIRPKLGQYIDKYSVRKEELMQLNGQLNAEAKAYNQLMDHLISQRTKQQQQQQQQTGQGQAGLPYPFAGGQYPSQAYGGQVPQFGGQMTSSSSPQASQYTQLAQQPTSNGFGNGPDYSQYLQLNSPPTQQTYFQPQQPQYTGQIQQTATGQPQRTGPRDPNQGPGYPNGNGYGERIGVGQGPTHYPSQQFLNINNFPDVSSM